MMSSLLRHANAHILYRPALVATHIVKQPHQQCKSAGSTMHYYMPSRCLSYPTALANFYQNVASSTPVHYIQHGLIGLHDCTGLPWWATIILATVASRVIITLPLSVYQNKIECRLLKIKEEMNDIVKELKFETKVAMQQYNWDEKYARSVYNHSMRKQWQKLIVRENCHPMKTFIVLWGQIPLWISQSFALRNLVSMFPDPNSFDAQMVHVGLSVGGFGWIPNLTLNDGTLILPVTMALLNLALIEMQILRRTDKQPGRLQRIVTWFMRGMSIVMIPVAASVPSALALYWTTSTATAFAQNLLILSPKFKRFTGIPTNVSNHLERPYQFMAIKLMERIRAGRERISLVKR